ncbi:MAG TPA: protein kinase [Candidatus Eisenbacteria bacterium]|nr:protein kinase [Candidatus Eisenbacteria bacterium]
MSSPDAEPPRDPRLIDLALHLVDDEPVDWEEARHTTGDLSETLERLRQIEMVARTHREAAPAPAPDGGPRAAPAFTWGRLEARDKLGEGAFGEVWRAWDPALRRDVALKLRRAGADTGAARWLREAQSLARIRHPNVVTVHGADVHDGRAGLWTDLIPGRTLEQVLQSLGPFGAREAAAIGMDLCAALASVHRAGLVHGDVKTRNIMREGSARDGTAEGAGRIVLMDFGTAHGSVDPAGDGASSAGTPLFAAPELLEGGAAGVSSDLYALGVVLYRLVTGRFPVEAASLAELRDAHARHDVVPLRTLRPDLPPAFVHAVERALAHDPAQRYRDAAAMERALAAAAGGVEREPAHRPTRFALGVGAGLAAAALVATAIVVIPPLLRPRFHVAPAGAPVAWRTKQVLRGNPDWHLGYVVTNVGDVDGDHVPDVVVTSFGAHDYHGRAQLFLGRPDGSLAPGPVFQMLPDENLFGFAVSAGDLDGDGYSDVVITGDRRDGIVPRTGRVYVYHGGPRFDGHYAQVLRGPQVDDEFGYALCAHGDLDHDGKADLVIGAPQLKPLPAAFVYFGKALLDTVPDLRIESPARDNQFASGLDVGDFNGDGAADIAIGARWDSHDGRYAGRVMIYYGGANLHASPDLVLHGPAPGAVLGFPSFVGDVDGDGYADLAVGAEGADGFAPGSGAVFLYRGGPNPSAEPALVYRGEQEGDLFGSAIVSEDLNGDGYADLVIPARRSDGFERDDGRVYVFFGGRHPDATADAVFAGSGLMSEFGTAVGTLPGRNGRFGSVLIGAPGRFAETRDNGEAFVYEFARYIITRPDAGTSVRAGAPLSVDWLGAEQADVSLSCDGGRSWRVVRRGAGGASQNAIAVPIPAGAAGPVQVRLTPAHGGRGEVTSAPVVVAAR